jgi:hypothetical protein
MLKKSFFIFFYGCMLSGHLSAQTTKPPVPTSPPPGPSMDVPKQGTTDSIMVTVIFKHKSDKNLAEVRRILESQGFWDVFPPKDARVLSWTIAVGMGHIIIMKLPAEATRRLHVAVANGAWGAYNTEIFLSYDYKPIWDEYMEHKAEAREEQEDSRN